MNTRGTKLIGRNEATFQCPHCGILSLCLLQEPARQLQGYYETIMLKDKGGQNHQTSVYLQYFIYRCVNCGKDTYFLFQNEAKIWSSGIGEGIPGIIAEEAAKVIHQFPVTNPTSHPSVPEDVRKATLEAEKCLSVGAYNACGVMARRAIQALCRDKGSKGEDLYNQLLFLRDKSLITPDLWDWAEELRIVGRSGAHPEWEEVSADDADYAVRFLWEIIRYVYINPSERAERKLKETKKKKDN